MDKVIYLIISTQPDTAHILFQLSQYILNPIPTYENISKYLLYYLHGTTKAGITFQGSGLDSDNISLKGYMDASYNRCIDSGKSTFKYIFTVARGAVSWKSKKQSIVTISSMESEYIAMTEVSKEAI